MAEWQPQEHHAAFPGILCGGVIGALIDCHSGAALAQVVKDAEGTWPWTESLAWATSSYSVELLRPTPLNQPVQLAASCVGPDADGAEVAVELYSGGKLRATGHASWRRIRPR